MAIARHEATDTDTQRRFSLTIQNGWELIGLCEWRSGVWADVPIHSSWWIVWQDQIADGKIAASP